MYIQTSLLKDNVLKNILNADEVVLTRNSTSAEYVVQVTYNIEVNNSSFLDYSRSIVLRKILYRFYKVGLASYAYNELKEKVEICKKETKRKLLQLMNYLKALIRKINPRSSKK